MNDASPPFLLSVARRGEEWESGEFPFTVPAVAGFSELNFTSRVTFLVGENGSGKSTLLEGIAAGLGKIAIGSEDLANDESLTAARRLGQALRFSWRRKTARGFFLRAEDFFGFTKRLKTMRSTFDEMEKQFESELEGYGLELARGSVRGQRSALISRYGEDLDANSHGESFLKLFQTRLVPEGLYLLDEPETPLSPMRQLTLLAMLRDGAAQGSQFIVATHSPILLALPGAQILSFVDGKIKEEEYDNLEHVSLTRSFLNNPELYLRHL